MTYPSLDAPSIIVASNGFSINNPNDGRYWAGAKNITTTNATLYSYTYEVTNILGQTLGWIPVNPGNMRFDYSAVNALAADLYFQNQSVTSFLVQNSMTKIEAGMNVTASLPQGNYTILPGADITFHAANSVILRAGMEVKNGALFKATADRFFKCTQYPNGRIGNKNEIRPEKSPISAYESTYVPDLLSQKDGITVYPNPFSSNFAVAYSIKAASAVVISVHDIAGNEIARFESNGPLNTGSYQLQIDAGNLVSGIYVIKYISNGTINAFKIIKK